MGEGEPRQGQRLAREVGRSGGRGESSPRPPSFHRATRPPTRGTHTRRISAAPYPLDAAFARTDLPQRSGSAEHPPADRHTRACAGLAGQRARADGAARPRSHPGAGGAPNARPGEARHGVSRRGIVVSPVDVGDLGACRRRVSRSRASPHAAPPNARAPRTGRSHGRCLTSCPASAMQRRTGADRARPAHPPSRLSVRSQPFHRVDARGVLRAHTPDLVPRARPRGQARRRRHRAPRPAAGDLRREAERAEDVMRRHIEGFERAIRAAL